MKKTRKRKPWSNTRRLLTHRPTRPSKMKTTPHVEPKMLSAPPTKCDKCGNPMIVAYEERISCFAVRMAHCPSGYGGCGKTWRLL